MLHLRVWREQETCGRVSVNDLVSCEEEQCLNRRQGTRFTVVSGGGDGGG